MDITSYLLGKKAGGGGGTVNLQEKDVTITTNTTTKIKPDTGYDGLKDVDVTTNVQPNNQTKSLTITENKTTTITPDQNYDGLSSVEVITNVSGGGDASEFFVTELPSDASANNWAKSNYIKKIANTLTIPDGINNIQFLFANFNVKVPNTFKIIGNNELVNIAYLFQKSGFQHIDLTGIYSPRLTEVSSMFVDCAELLDVNLTGFNPNTSQFSAVFSGCTKITSIDLSSYTRSMTKIYQAFKNCTSLQFLDIRGMTLSGITASAGYSGAFDNVPANCLIIVGSDTQKTWVTTKFPSLTNVKTVAEYEESLNQQ